MIRLDDRLEVAGGAVAMGLGYGGLDEAVDGFHDAMMALAVSHRALTVSENPSAYPLTDNPKRPVPPSGVGGRVALSVQTLISSHQHIISTQLKTL